MNLFPFLQKETVPYGYVVTKTANDIGILETDNKLTQIMRIPAAIFCYWLGESEIVGKSILADENQ